MKTTGLVIVGVGFLMMVGFGLAGQRRIAGFGFPVMCLGGFLTTIGE